MLKRAAQQHPTNTCTMDAESGRVRTYAETEQRVSKLAGALLQAGLSKEGRVALVMLNSDRYFESFFACAWAGGIVVPIKCVSLEPWRVIETAGWAVPVEPPICIGLAQHSAGTSRDD